MDKKKYIIFGINGMAGHVIGQYLKEKGHHVIGFARQESPVCKTVIGDARNAKDIDNVLKTVGECDVVVNCIGILNKHVDAKLSDGIYLNSVFPHLLAEKLSDTGIKLIHISSDCVYEGTVGNYTEKDIPDAISCYGRTKALGEIVDNKNLTFRTSIVGPELKADGIGLFHWFMSQRGAVEGYRKVIWSGVTTLQLAKAIEEDRAKQQTGLFHLVNNKTICKYDLLKLFNKYCRSTPIKIMENDTIVSDKSIFNTQKDMAFHVPGYEEMVGEMAEWIRNHPELYGQYKENMR
ncbi:MAG: sugar nucleotide-binding protein [Hungatella sp.]|nr:sugar nucleotide-binding protein [Hungatella sp.]